MATPVVILYVDNGNVVAVVPSTPLPLWFTALRRQALPPAAGPTDYHPEVGQVLNVLRAESRVSESPVLTSAQKEEALALLRIIPGGPEVDYRHAGDLQTLIASGLVPAPPVLPPNRDPYATPRVRGLLS